jgi:DtxR family Mn-dependent transcriptional regulator
MFLHETLGYGWDEVHDEADRLEHFISRDGGTHCSKPGRPATTHGDPIDPLAHDRLPALPLSQLRPPQQASVQQCVTPIQSCWLPGRSGITPEASLTVLITRLRRQPADSG